MISTRQPSLADSDATELPELGPTGRLAATAISLALNLLIWIAGVGIGYLAGTPAVALAGAMLLGRRWVRRPWPRSLLKDLAVAVAVGFLVSFLYRLDAALYRLDLFDRIGVEGWLVAEICMVTGGFAGGIVRRRFLFSRFFESVFVKLPVLALALVALINVLAVSLAVVARRAEVPDELVTPAKIPAGWKENDRATGSDLTGIGIEYEKGQSGLQISAQLIPGTSPLDRSDAEFVVDSYAAVSRANGVKVSSSLVGQSASPVMRGGPRITYHYRLDQTGDTSFPRVEILVHHFYCPDPGMPIRALAVIKNHPFEQFVEEVEEMVSTLECP